MIPILPNSDSISTRLTYSLQPNPSPITAIPADTGSVPLSDLPQFSLIVLMTNDTHDVLQINTITISIPYGKSANDLFNDSSTIHAVASDPNYFVYPQYQNTVAEFVVLSDVGGTPPVIAPGDSMYVVIWGVTPNDAAGRRGDHHRGERRRQRGELDDVSAAG